MYICMQTIKWHYSKFLKIRDGVTQTRSKIERQLERLERGMYLSEFKNITVSDRVNALMRDISTSLVYRSTLL